MVTVSQGIQDPAYSPPRPTQYSRDLPRSPSRGDGERAQIQLAAAIAPRVIHEPRPAADVHEERAAARSREPSATPEKRGRALHERAKRRRRYGVAHAVLLAPVAAGVEQPEAGPPREDRRPFPRPVAEPLPALADVYQFGPCAGDVQHVRAQRQDRDAVMVRTVH